MFPTLSAAQIARIASRGVIRPITRGEVLIEGGQTNVPFFVVKAGEIEVIRPSGLGDLLVAVVHADQFTGDISMILGRPALMRLRVSESGEVVQLTRDQMHALIQTDTEIERSADESVDLSTDRAGGAGDWRRAAHRRPPTPRQRYVSRHSSRATTTLSSISTSTVMRTCGTCSIASEWTRPNYRS